jgi:hypothetical protein
MNEARCPECCDMVSAAQHAALIEGYYFVDHWVNQGDDPDNRSHLCAGSGQTVRFELPDYVNVLFAYLWKTLGDSFERRTDRTFCEYSYTLKIDGLTVRPYYPNSDEPNFVFGGASLWWYKRPGRSMETSVDWTPEQWVKWFDDCSVTVRYWEVLKWSER